MFIVLLKSPLYSFLLVDKLHTIEFRISEKALNIAEYYDEWNFSREEITGRC